MTTYKIIEYAWKSDRKYFCSVLEEPNGSQHVYDEDFGFIQLDLVSPSKIYTVEVA